MDKDEIGADTPFNMAMLYYMELHRLREYKSKTVMEGNMYLYCDVLEEIYISIHFKVTDTEQKGLEADFKKAKQSLRMGGANRREIVTMSMNNAKEILQGIDKKLINIMYKNHMIFPNIDVSGGLAKIEKRYGL